ncbi:MAG: hypothetical protein ACXQT3_00600 [Methermicoccaceae archaeon]
MKITRQALFRLYYVSLAASVIGGVLYHTLSNPEGHFVWDKIPAFHALFGLVGCSVLIVVALGLHPWLLKDEDYYEKH